MPVSLEAFATEDPGEVAIATTPSFASALEQEEEEEAADGGDDTTSTTPTANNHSTPTTTTTTTNNIRQGTISSARFNILCTMVGGGCLSLPFGFQKTGNALMGPICLLVTACITDYCFRMIVTGTRQLHPVNRHTTRIGRDSFEGLTGAAFGPKGYQLAKHLVTAMCFFGAVGYAVLLRDMLEPIATAIANRMDGHHDGHTNHTIVPGNGTHANGTLTYTMMESTVRHMLENTDDYAHYLEDNEGSSSPKTNSGPSLISNLVMLTVILLITPVCTLQNLSSLEQLGAASMSSILILGGCIVYRSVQCNMGQHPYHDGGGDSTMWTMEEDAPVWPAFQLFPESWKDVLDAFPLFVSCYVCHYNIPAVHNELQTPTPKRVQYWLRSTTVAATMFYMVVGLAGSAYGHCTPTGKVQGNVLLDFDEDDPLLLVARMCLACTITLAFPLLVIPARDILLRSWFYSASADATVTVTITSSTDNNDDAVEQTAESALREPLLSSDDGDDANGEEGVEAIAPPTPTNRAPASTSIIAAAEPKQHSWGMRLGTAVLVLWTAAAVACCVKSIDVVWDLLGSSLSILLSYLIPCGSFIVIMGRSSSNNDNTNIDDDNDEEGANRNPSWKRKGAILLAKAMLFVYIPLMFISTCNAMYDTFLI